MTDTTRGLPPEEADNIRFECDCEWVRSMRGLNDWNRLRTGIRIARMDNHYGAGLIEKVAGRTGYGISTLKEYRQIAIFAVRWLGLAARRLFDEYPYLSYSHLREAVRYTDDLEERIELLLAVANGDPNHPEFNANLPMTVDAFRTYLDKREGRPVPPPPLFDMEGIGWQVHMELNRTLNVWKNRRVRVTVKRIVDE